MGKHYPSQEQVEEFVRNNHLGKNVILEIIPEGNIWITQEATECPDDYYEIAPVTAYDKRYQLLRRMEEPKSSAVN